MRDPQQSPTHFFNASWAKVYVPVRIGFERQALRWIFGRVVDTPLDDAMEAAFDQFEADLRQYRLDSFGDEREAPTGPAGDDQIVERFLRLARWNELLPTDGTHVEVVQSMTTAADQTSQAETATSAAWQAALLAEKQRGVELLAEQVEEAKQCVAILHEEVEAAKRGGALADQEVALAAQDVEKRKRDVALQQALAQSAQKDLDLKNRAGDLIKGSVGVQVQIATLVDGDGE